MKEYLRRICTPYLGTLPYSPAACVSVANDGEGGNTMMIWLASTRTAQKLEMR